MGDAEQTQPVSRRIVNYLLAGTSFATLAAIVYPVIRFLIPPHVVESSQTSVVAGKVFEFKPNSGKVFPFGSKPAIVIETPGGKIRAFTAVCTHLQCTVQYRPDLRHIWCGCHNGHYDLYGKNISGPPPPDRLRGTRSTSAEQISWFRRNRPGVTGYIPHHKSLPIIPSQHAGQSGGMPPHSTAPAARSEDPRS
jgi:Rieske Fe-S protein